MKDWHAKSAHMDVAYITGDSVSDEIGRSVTADLYLIVISVTVFVVVAVVLMSRWNGVSTRSTLALIGVGSAVLSIIAAYGLAMAFGCPFTTLQQTLPYVLIGIAVDCMFILAKVGRCGGLVLGCTCDISVHMCRYLPTYIPTQLR